MHLSSCEMRLRHGERRVNMDFADCWAVAIQMGHWKVYEGKRPSSVLFFPMCIRRNATEVSAVLCM